MDIDQPEEPFPIKNVITLNLRRFSRVSHPLERYSFLYEMQELYVHEKSIHVDDPTTYEEALCDKDSSRWIDAMKTEMDSMYVNQVWMLIDPPKGIVPIGCKWIFKRKIGADRKVDTYKARLVAKVFCQRQGVNYEETFSPVAILKSIQILIAIATNYDYKVWKMDVKTAFLNGYIEEDIFMEQPKGFEFEES